MDTNFYLNPSEVRAQAEAYISQLENYNGYLHLEVRELDQFISDREINSVAFDALKEIARDIRRAKRAKTVANDALIADYRLLMEHVGDEILDGEQIQTGIDTAELMISAWTAERDRLTRRINELGGIGDTVFTSRGYFDNVISQENIDLINGYDTSRRNANQIIRNQEAIRDAYIHKVEMYWAIERITKNLFTNANDLQGEISTGVSYMITAATGLPDSYDVALLADWRTSIAIMQDYVSEGIVLADRLTQLLKVLRGCQYTIAAIGDPINASTGNFIYPTSDMTVEGHFPLTFKRFYNSRSDDVGVLGKGWTHNHDIVVIPCNIEDNEKITIIQFGEDGHQEHFRVDEDGKYISPKGRFSKLEKLEEDAHLLTYPDQSSYRFNSLGLVELFKDKFGNETKYEYMTQGETKTVLLAKVSTPSGHFMFVYNEDNRLTSVMDHSERVIQFDYNERNTLASFTNPSGHVTKYDYDCGNRLETITNAEGNVVLKNIYDGWGRGIKQVFPDATVMEYTYDKQMMNATAFIERNKSVAVYKRDSEYRTTEIIHPNGGRESFEYNENNQRTEHYDERDVLKMSADYNDKGNMISITNALGVTTEFDYTEDNQVSKVKVDGKEKVVNVYDQEGNLLEVKNALNHTTEIEYLERGIPNKIVRPDGSVVSFSYDERRNVTQVIDGSGIITRYEYDNLNRPIAIIDGNGNKTSYQYDAQNNVTEVVDAQGNTQKYEYNKINHVTSFENFDGSVIRYEYNKLNRPSKIIDPLGRETKFSYDNMWNVAAITLPNGGRIRRFYSEFNQLEEVCKPDGGKINFQYDLRGNRTAIIDECGYMTYFGYDELGQLTSTWNNDVGMTMKYNAMGQVIQVEDGEGNILKRTYNDGGQLIEEENTAGDQRQYTYSPLDKIATITDEANRVTRLHYMLGGQLKEIVYPDGSLDTCSYDNNGNIKTLTQRTGLTLTYEYDALNRVISITASNGGTKKYTYDAANNVTSMTDERGNATHYEYTLAGKLSKVIDPLGNIALYTYDEMDQVIEIRQLGENQVPLDEDLKDAIVLNEENRFCITRYKRNQMGQVESICDALGHEEHFKYNLRGELIEKMDKEGFLTTYAYTPHGDVEQIQYADGKEVKMKYNQLRQLTEIQDWLGTTKISLDYLGRPLEVVDHNNKAVTYEWGKLGEKRKISYPGGQVVNYDYDDVMRMIEVDDGTSKVSYLYDECSRLSEKRFASGLITSVGYNAEGKLREIVHQNPEEVLDSFEYQYDLAGNRTMVKKYRSGLPEDTGLFEYTYDSLNRLQGVTKDGAHVRSYGYDEFGNRIRKVEREGEQESETTYHFNALNQLISTADTKNQTEKFIYDKRGNLTERYLNDILMNQYEFNPLGRLDKAINYKTNQHAIYRYNGLGHRVGRGVGVGIEVPRLVPTKHTDDVLDFTKRYHNLLERGDTAYVWDMNLLSAIDGDNKIHEYLLDNLGSPVRFGQESLGYDEFGNLTTEQNNTQPFGFTGYQRDEIANTWYAQAREYNPQIGRFLSEDAIKGFLHQPLTQNPYTYCSNKPLNHLDLDGNFDKPDHDELTYYAGIILGLSPEVICMLQAGNRSVDDFISPTNPFLPVPLGNQLPHFNRNNPGEIDSRLVFADRYFNQASQILENRYFSRELEIIISNLVPHYLGRGLHAIQDIHAHGQISAGSELLNWNVGHMWHSLNIWFGIGTYRGNPDSFYYDWLGDCQVFLDLDGVPDRRLNMRYLMAILDSVDYLNRFQEETGFSLKDILY